jgi:hypothetical protein
MKRRIALLCLFIGILAACGAFPEATFSLSPESRLPRWFKVPTGMSRRDVNVGMSYYVTPSGRTARFDLYDSQRNSVAEASGTLRGLEPLRIGSAKSGYPSYEVITVHGIVEIIEHRRMDDVFYVTDDEGVRKELGVRAGR